MPVILVVTPLLLTPTPHHPCWLSFHPQESQQLSFIVQTYYSIINLIDCDRAARKPLSIFKSSHFLKFEMFYFSFHAMLSDETINSIAPYMYKPYFI